MMKLRALDQHHHRGLGSLDMAGWGERSHARKQRHHDVKRDRKYCIIVKCTMDMFINQSANETSPSNTPVPPAPSRASRKNQGPVSAFFQHTGRMRVTIVSVVFVHEKLRAAMPLTQTGPSIKSSRRKQNTHELNHAGG